MRQPTRTGCAMAAPEDTVLHALDSRPSFSHHSRTVSFM